LTRIARALACAPRLTLDGDSGAHDEIHARLRFAWVPPIAFYCVAYFTPVGTMQRVKRIVSEWGTDKETRGLAAMAHIITGGPYGAEWRGVARHAAKNFYAVRFPFAVLTPPFLGDEPLTPWERMHLEGALMAPAFDEVDAYISYTYAGDIQAKYVALSTWAGYFEEQHGRPPTVWLDRACGDTFGYSITYMPIYVRHATHTALPRLAPESKLSLSRPMSRP